MHVYMHVHAHVTTCCAWLNAVCMESEHTERFVAAIKGYVHSHACIHAYRYEWEIAEILAISADELQDVADSQLRKAELYAYIYKYIRAFIYYVLSYITPFSTHTAGHADSRLRKTQLYHRMQVRCR